mgnify:CR=1 FL=1
MYADELAINKRCVDVISGNSTLILNRWMVGSQLHVPNEILHSILGTIKWNNMYTSTTYNIFWAEIFNTWTGNLNDWAEHLCDWNGYFYDWAYIKYYCCYYYIDKMLSICHYMMT